MEDKSKALATGTFPRTEGENRMQRDDDEPRDGVQQQQQQQRRQEGEEETKRQSEPPSEEGEAGAGTAASIQEFVNEGLLRWEENRASWLKSDTSDSTAKAAIPLDVDAIIDLIFSQRWRNQEGDNSRFPQPVPLTQMVDILVDLWEAEGLDI